MPIINVPLSDLLRNQPLEKGYYPCECIGVSQAMSKAGDSINYAFTCRIEKDGRNYDCKFNSKAMGMMESFIAVIEEKTVTEVREYAKTHGEAYPFDTDHAAGKKFDIELTVGVFDGRPKQEHSGNFLPYKKSQEAQPY